MSMRIYCVRLDLVGHDQVAGDLPRPIVRLVMRHMHGWRPDPWDVEHQDPLPYLGHQALDVGAAHAAPIDESHRRYLPVATLTTRKCGCAPGVFERVRQSSTASTQSRSVRTSLQSRSSGSGTEAASMR